MSGSYSRIYIHLVFAPKSRNPLHDNDKRERLLNYMAGLITNHKSHLITGYIMPDHVHLLIGLHPSMSVSEITQKVKANSSKLVNDEKWYGGKFAWNEGYGAFSVSQSKLSVVTKYIAGQEEHHKKHKLYDEMMEFLKAHGLKTDETDHFWCDKQ
jgi:putative transposase